MKKTATIILAIISLLSLAITIITPSIEIFHINPEWITIGSTILLAIKQFIEQSGMLTKAEAAQFANYEKDARIYGKEQLMSTEDDVGNWQSNKR